MAIVTIVLPLDEIVEGMELDADVMDGVGRALVRAGVIVTEKHLRIFHMCGIQELRVRRQGPDDAPEPSAEVLAARQEADDLMRPRFRRTHLTHPAVAALFSECVARAVDRSRWSGASTDA
jgi:hypothetical protein